MTFCIQKVVASRKYREAKNVVLDKLLFGDICNFWKKNNNWSDCNEKWVNFQKIDKQHKTKHITNGPKLHIPAILWARHQWNQPNPLYMWMSHDLWYTCINVTWSTIHAIVTWSTVHMYKYHKIYGTCNCHMIYGTCNCHMIYGIYTCYMIQPTDTP